MYKSYSEKNKTRLQRKQDRQNIFEHNKNQNKKYRERTKSKSS